MIGLAATVVFLSGCSTTVQVSARFPARNPDAAELRRIAVADFDGPDGNEFANALESSLASAQFDGAQYFTIVDTGNRSIRVEAKAASAYGRSVGAQGVYLGHVQTQSFQNQAFEGTVMVCVNTDANGNCTKLGVQVVPCTKRVLQMSVLPMLVKVANGQVVYSARKFASTDTSWCQGQGQQVGDNELVYGARNQILNDLRLDVAPYNATLQATIKESDDGLPDQAAKQFDAAVDAAKKHDMGEACRLWGEVDRSSADHPWTVYDLGVCAETNGDYTRALGLYLRARTLAPKVDSDVAESIARAQKLIGAHGELAREEKVRSDQVAAARKQAAEQERERQQQAKAAKAAQEAKHAKLVATYGAKNAGYVEAGEIHVGMSAAAVIAAKGNPSRREKVPPNSELWHYGSQEIGFTNGKVTHIGQ
jgi:hypothetical protein